MIRFATAFAFSLSLAIVGLAGCSDDFGEPCAFPSLPQCEPQGDSAATCVFRNSAQCDSRICAVYNGSSGFCTETCDVEAQDCPSSAICELPPAAQNAICIPLELYDVAAEESSSEE